jgi:Mrp family chromosome partitioning ATPase
VDCIHPSPLNEAVSVLRAGPPPQHRVAGPARSAAAAALLATAKSSFDIVLIDSPALLQVAGATPLVDSSDAAVIVLSPNEQIQDHLEMVNRIRSIGTSIVGYIYNRAPVSSRYHRAPAPRLARYQRNGSPARSRDALALALSANSASQRPNGGGSRPADHGHG